MCWEDQKKARTLETQSAVVAGGGGLVLPANPMRVRLAISFDQNANGITTVFSGGNPAAALSSINAGRPTDVLRIEDYGQALTGPVSIDATGAGGPTGVTQTILNEPY